MSESHRSSGTVTRFVRLAPCLLIGGIVLFHAVNNWIWLTDNVTSTGWDKPRHLARSLYLAQILNPVTIRSLFTAVVSDPVRPPVFPISGAIMYQLFGPRDDTAVMVNIGYLIIVLAATYGIGYRWGGRPLGLVSVALLAILPMFYAMSRYFYVEFALGAMVALTIYLMLATEGFQRRGFSWFFGLSLGLGLLTKRTFPVFALGPVLVYLFTSGLWSRLWQRLKRRPQLNWKRALLALAGGLLLAAIWYLPNRESVQGFVLGDALFLIWGGLAALTLYFVSLPPDPLSNAFSAFFMAAGMGSLWYLACLEEVVRRVALYGYGIEDPRGRTMRLDQLGTYLYYLRKLGNEHLSPVLFVMFCLIVLVAAVLYLRRHSSVRDALRHIRPEGWVALAWAGGAYAILTFSIYQETRAYTPALPAVALIFGASLLQWPWRRLRWAVLALVLAFGLCQFFVISYEPVYRLMPPRFITLPGWGQTSTFAQGVYLQLPDEGKTDRGYAIYPDVLDRMERRRQDVGRELLSLGMLVNTSQINAGPFNFLILTQYPNLRVESLIERFNESSPYRRLFAHDYVLVKRINAGMNPAQKQVILDILNRPPRLFEQAFELETTYPLPDGDTVYLYRQRHFLPADYPLEYIEHLVEKLNGRTREGDVILVTPSAFLSPLAARYNGAAEIYLVPTTEEGWRGIATPHRRIFLIVGDARVAGGDGQGLDWLNQHAFWTGHEWSDSLQLITYGTASGPLAMAPTLQVGADLGGQFRLVGADRPAAPWHPGDIAPLTLFWQKQAATTEDYAVFVHLLDEKGHLAAQTDCAPVGGSRPTSGWAKDELVIDRHGLPLPEDLQPGRYELRVGMYLPTSGKRLPVAGTEGAALGDSVSLGWVRIEVPSR